MNPASKVTDKKLRPSRRQILVSILFGIVTGVMLAMSIFVYQVTQKSKVPWRPLSLTSAEFSATPSVNFSEGTVEPEGVVISDFECGGCRQLWSSGLTTPSSAGEKSGYRYVFLALPGHKKALDATVALVSLKDDELKKDFCRYLFETPIAQWDMKRYWTEKGLSPDALDSALKDPKIRESVIASTNAWIDSGIAGTPSFGYYDGQSVQLAPSLELMKRKLGE